jgi:osmotically-inducible protein OsmY
MKNTLLFTTLVAGLALSGCNKTTRTSTADTTVPPATDTSVTSRPVTTTDTVGARVDRAGDRVADATRNAADNVRDASRDAAASMRQAGRDVSARLTEWKLNASDIEADVLAKRDIVRTRSDVLTPTGNVDKGNLEKSIKAQLNADPKLPDLKFDVNANTKGEVELEGKARTTDQIAHAMAVALSHDGVAKVTSKIKIDPDAGPNRR